MNIQLLQYSDKAVVLLGDTKPIKDQLKALNGKFNPFLKDPITGGRVMGWVFSKKHESELKRLFVNPFVEGREPVAPVKAPKPLIEPKTAPIPKEVAIVQPKQKERVKTPFQLLANEDKKEYAKFCDYSGLNFNYAANICRYTLEQVQYIHANFTKFNRKSIVKENTTKDVPFIAIFEPCENAAFIGKRTFKNMKEFDLFLTQIRYDRILVGKRNRKTNQIEENYQDVLKEKHAVKITFKQL